MLGRLKEIVCLTSARAFNFLSINDFSGVCVSFSRARIQFSKLSDAKQTISFKRPYCFRMSDLRIQTLGQAPLSYHHY